MNGADTIEESARAASRILTAMQNGDLADLESGLERAERLASRQPIPVPHAVEQLELLGAVAVQMRRSIARFGRRLTPHLEGVEVHLQLLRHLAKLPPSAASTCPEPLSVPAS